MCDGSPASDGVHRDCSMTIITGRVIRIASSGERDVYTDVRSASHNTRCAKPNKIGKCALGVRQNHAGFKWEYEQIREYDGEKWQRDPLTGAMCSNMGRFCLPRTNKITNVYQIRYGYPNISGYMYWTWRKTTQSVHRMIARAFLGAVPIDEHGNVYDVDHINGDKKDNRLSNLQYLSKKEHVQKTRSTTTFNNNPRTRGVERISTDLKEIIKFDSAQKAAESVGDKTAGGICNACGRSSIVGDWNLHFEETAGKDVPEFGGFSGRRGDKRKVVAINCTTGDTRVYETASACALDIHYSQAAVSSACTRTNYFKGYFWRYVDHTVLVDEEWRVCSSRPVEVSSYGRIRMKNGCILEEFTSVGDYKKYSGIYVHVLVAEAFLGPLPYDENGRRYDVDHIDGNPANNRASNLQYLSRLEHARKTHSIDQRSSGHKREREKQLNDSQPRIKSHFKRGQDLKQRKRRKT